MQFNINRRPDRITDPLYVVTVIFNPIRFNTRWVLYNKFKSYLKQFKNVVLYTAEIAFGDREFCLTEPNNPHHLQLRTLDAIWHKERALNLLIRKLPLDWKYVAWLDADISFVRDDWANETIHQLQHYEVVQMFNEAIDFDYNYLLLLRHKGFVASWKAGLVPAKNGYYGTPDKQNIIPYHPGFGWAWNRSAYDIVGGFFDKGILGAGDNHMAKGLIGEAINSVHPEISTGYKNAVLNWEQKALKLNKDIGFVEGTILHYWHGPKVNRKYWDRWKILVETQFDPNTDLQTDWQGLYRVEDIKLRDLIREYFAQRNEDAQS